MRPFRNSSTFLWRFFSAFTFTVALHYVFVPFTYIFRLASQMPVFRFSSIHLTFSSSHPHFSYAFFSVRFSIHFFFVLSCCRSYAPFSFTFQLMAQLYFRRTYTSPLIAKKGAQQMCQALFLWPAHSPSSNGSKAHLTIEFILSTVPISIDANPLMTGLV